MIQIYKSYNISQHKFLPIFKWTFGTQELKPYKNITKCSLIQHHDINADKIIKEKYECNQEIFINDISIYNEGIYQCYTVLWIDRKRSFSFAKKRYRVRDCNCSKGVTVTLPHPVCRCLCLKNNSRFEGNILDSGRDAKNTHKCVVYKCK